MSDEIETRQGRGISRRVVVNVKRGERGKRGGGLIIESRSSEEGGNQWKEVVDA